jgi:hypothetical protein
MRAAARADQTASPTLPWPTPLVPRLARQSTREVAGAWIKEADLYPKDHRFPSRLHALPHLGVLWEPQAGDRLR